MTPALELRENQRWSGAFALALAAHLAAGLAAFNWVRDADVMTPEGPVVLLDLPPANIPAEQAPQAPEPPRPAPPKPVAAKAPPPRPAPDAAIPLPTPMQPVAPAPETARDTPAPAETVPESSPAPATPADQAAAPPDAKTRDKQLNYYATLMGWLNRNKTYPAEAKKARQQGVVTVRFTIDKAGNVIAAAIKNSGGYPALDDAALELMRRASPLPAIPDFMQKQQLTISLPVEYSLITD